MHQVLLRTIGTLISVLLHPVVGSAQKAPLEIHRLTENCHVFTTYNMFNGVRFPSNGMYLVTPEGVVLFDTPWDTTQFQPLLDSIWLKHRQQVILAVSTHYHDDRTAGLSFLRNKGVKTYTSRKTRELCAQFNNPESEFIFTGDTVFHIGGFEMETFFPGEGHTPDNIVIWFRNEKILYGGCLVKSTVNETLGNTADANLRAWPTSIKRVIRKYKSPAFVVPGHFGWSSPRALPHTLKLLKQAGA